MTRLLLTLSILLATRVAVPGELKLVDFSLVAELTQELQGESECVDTLLAQYGTAAEIADGAERYSIENVCDF